LMGMLAEYSKDSCLDLLSGFSKISSRSMLQLVPCVLFAGSRSTASARA
jgi:hypothetical protein